MSYPEIEEYAGEKTACDNCARTFKRGEVITVDTRKDYTFCYSDSGGGCLIAFVFSSGEASMGCSMRFGGSPVMRPENATPNYPNTPVINQEKRKRLHWLRNLLDGW